MDNTILSVNTLPELLHRRIRADRVRVREENGEIILTPLQGSPKGTWPTLNKLRAKISDGRVSTANYAIQKQLDKELER